MLSRLTERQEWKFFRVLPQADAKLATAWWAIVLLRGTLPAALAIVMGWLVGAIQAGESLTAPLIALGVVFITLQTITPIHQAVSSNLGSRTAAMLYD
ncbi:MAG: ABC transporter ATP-binding protein, partial [Tepidiformaceae bacterium]